MKNYRIVVEGRSHKVQEGSHVPTFFWGEPNYSWVTVGTFWTMSEAQQFIEFYKKASPGDIFHVGN